MSESTTSPNFIELSADIVSAYVSNNSVPASELPALLSSVYSALTKTGQAQSQEPQVELTPAVPVKKSVTADGRSSSRSSAICGPPTT
jgi:predicted transcriptional regulator